MSRARTLWEEGHEPGRQVVALGLALALSVVALDVGIGGRVGLFFDLAFVGYVAHAPEGGLQLDRYPALRAWLGRVEALPGFEPMPASPLPSVMATSDER